MKNPVCASGSFFVQQSVNKVLTDRCRFFSGSVTCRSCRRFLRLRRASDFGCNSSSSTVYGAYSTELS